MATVQDVKEGTHKTLDFTAALCSTPHTVGFYFLLPHSQGVEGVHTISALG